MVRTLDGKPDHYKQGQTAHKKSTKIKHTATQTSKHRKTGIDKMTYREL